MKIAEDKLIGWLVLIASQGEGVCVPDGVWKALMERGWVEEHAFDKSMMTEAGCSVVDLNAAEWGLEYDWTSERE
jgi:hypothetical protein